MCAIEWRERTVKDGCSSWRMPDFLAKHTSTASMCSIDRRSVQALQELQSRRDALFLLLGAPRPLDATIRVFEGKPLIQVSFITLGMQPVAYEELL